MDKDIEKWLTVLQKSIDLEKAKQDTQTNTICILLASSIVFVIGAFIGSNGCFCKGV